MSGISKSSVRDTPIAIVDLETTGLHPEGDRVVEIAIVRQDPGGSPEVILDTLVNPERRVAATEIHGISQADVRDAPTFAEIAPLVTSSLSGAAFASYNVYFDARFLRAELGRAGAEDFPPHLCLMYMRPMLGLGPRCSLGDACEAHGVRHENAHSAGDDAEASAQLWLKYVDHMDQLDVRTFGDLAKRKRYKFTKSFGAAFLEEEAPPEIPRLKSRRTAGPSAPSPDSTPQLRRAEYWDALKAALADFAISDEEVRYLAGKREKLQLTDAEVRSLHARAFAGLLAELADDHRIDSQEVEWIARMSHALGALGWSPGGRIESESARRGFLSRLFDR